jgi:gas vesicle protein
MKRFFVVMLVLTVALGVFAAGYKGFSERPAFERQPMGYAQQFPGCGGGPGYGPNAPMYERPQMRAERGFGYGLKLQIRDEEQLKLALKTRIAEALNNLDLNDDQLKELYNVAKETKEQLDSLKEKFVQLHEEYYNALVKRDTKTAEDLKDQIDDLRDEVQDIYKDFADKVDDIITVDQYRKFRGSERMFLVLLSDEGFEVQDMVQE